MKSGGEEVWRDEGGRSGLADALRPPDLSALVLPNASEPNGCHQSGPSSFIIHPSSLKAFIIHPSSLNLEGLHPSSFILLSGQTILQVGKLRPSFAPMIARIPRILFALLLATAS